MKGNRHIPLSSSAPQLLPLSASAPAASPLARPPCLKSPSYSTINLSRPAPASDEPLDEPRARSPQSPPRTIVPLPRIAAAHPRDEVRLLPSGGCSEDRQLHAASQLSLASEPLGGFRLHRPERLRLHSPSAASSASFGIDAGEPPSPQLHLNHMSVFSPTQSSSKKPYNLGGGFNVRATGRPSSKNSGSRTASPRSPRRKTVQESDTLAIDSQDGVTEEDSRGSLGIHLIERSRSSDSATTADPSALERSFFTSIADVRQVVLHRTFGDSAREANSWHRVILSEKFLSWTRRRRELIKRMVDVIRLLIVTTEQKINLLAGVPLFASLTMSGLREVARMMTTRLVSRYEKVQRAVQRPNRFQILVWGSLYAADETGGVQQLNVGAAFGETALILDTTGRGDQIQADRSIVTSDATSLLICIHREQLTTQWWLSEVRQGYAAYVTQKRKTFLLHKLPMLSSASAEFRAKLSQLMKYHLRKSATVLFSPGDVSDKAWLLVRGTVVCRAKEGTSIFIEGPDWVGAGAIFAKKERRWSAEVVSEQAEMLCLYSSSFTPFCKLVPMLLQTMRTRERRIASLLLDDDQGRSGGFEERVGVDSLQQQQKMARELGFRAQLRLEQQKESLSQLQKGQEISTRASFISSLVPAYTLVDQFGRRVPVKVVDIKPLAMNAWWASLSMVGGHDN
ncbi:hypothetical protein AB1Y20_017927 [Prymnesium parvum]|uniref:Cyclic nucleotide-binding domain-containing protein n=1 Tax=Prymnesium parvum TaxID=97485 RepID=A0AB34JMM2_PRYPA